MRSHLLTASYSKLRLLLAGAFLFADGRTPGLMNAPIVTGISPLLDQVIEDDGDAVRAVTVLELIAILKTIRAAAVLGLYCAATYTQ